MQKGRLILVDDEPYVTTTLAARFRKEGFEVRTANNGEDAFALAVEAPPDVLITDYQMPILSGYEMSVKLKADPRTSQVPVVMLTARGHHLSSEQLGMTNIEVVFPKPFSARELLAKVNQILAARPAQGVGGSANG
jgi:two-component system phosphate regulon response regulator PhoB